MQTFVSSRYFLLIVVEIGQFAFVTCGLTADADGFQHLVADGVVLPRANHLLKQLVLLRLGLFPFGLYYWHGLFLGSSLLVQVISEPTLVARRECHRVQEVQHCVH